LICPTPLSCEVIDLVAISEYCDTESDKDKSDEEFHDLLDRDKLGVYHFWDIEPESFDEAFIEIIIFLLSSKGEMIDHFSSLEVLGRERFDIEPSLIEDICDLPEEATFISKYYIHHDRDTLYFSTTPSCWYPSRESDSIHIFTVKTMYRHDSSSYSSYDFLSWFWTTAERHLVWDISLFSDDDTLSFFLFSTSFLSFFIFFLYEFFFTKKFLEPRVIDRTKDACRLS
jgi:hypothetical protein